jgi:hypothetical protein
VNSSGFDSKFRIIYLYSFYNLLHIIFIQIKKGCHILAIAIQCSFTGWLIRHCLRISMLYHKNTLSYYITQPIIRFITMIIFKWHWRNHAFTSYHREMGPVWQWYVRCNSSLRLYRLHILVHPISLIIPSHKTRGPLICTKRFNIYSTPRICIFNIIESTVNRSFFISFISFVLYLNVEIWRDEFFLGGVWATVAA